MPKTAKPKKKVRSWKMFALIDCEWGTIRETGSITFLKCANQCPTCKIIPVTITEVGGRRKESR